MESLRVEDGETVKSDGVEESEWKCMVCWPNKKPDEGFLGK
jgi:hypothetical protein